MNEFLINQMIIPQKPSFPMSCLFRSLKRSNGESLEGIREANLRKAIDAVAACTQTERSQASRTMREPESLH